MDSLIKVWDLRSNVLLQQFSAHAGAVTHLSFHPSGNFLLSSSLDATLKVWDLREGQLFYTLHGHEGATMATDFSPAGDFFASGGADEQVHPSPPLSSPYPHKFRQIMASCLLSENAKLLRLAFSCQLALQISSGSSCEAEYSRPQYSRPNLFQ